MVQTLFHMNVNHCTLMQTQTGKCYGQHVLLHYIRILEYRVTLPFLRCHDILATKKLSKSTKQRVQLMLFLQRRTPLPTPYPNKMQHDRELVILSMAKPPPPLSKGSFVLIYPYYNVHLNCTHLAWHNEDTVSCYKYTLYLVCKIPFLALSEWKCHRLIV